MRALAIALAVACGCGGASRPRDPTTSAERAALPDVRLAKDRPPVVIVARDGDPAAAVAAAAVTSGVEGEVEVAVALAGVLEARLGGRATVTSSWDGLRAVALARDAAEAAALADALRAAMLAPIEDKDVASADKKLAALAQRPLRDAALVPWARCVGSPFATPDRAGKPVEASVARLEQWRASVFGLSRVAISVAGTAAAGEAVASAIAKGPAWKDAAPVKVDAPASKVDVYDVTDGPHAMVHATLDVPTSGVAVALAEALGDPRGAFASRLAELDLPFRIRDVIGAAHANGGCVGVVLEAARENAELAARVADAIALLDVEAEAAASETTKDGRALARRAGDVREAAERAAWWALADKSEAKPGARTVALGVPVRREKVEIDLAGAIDRATAAWKKPIVELRSRIEAGQGETWVLFASPCGTDAETDADAGLTAAFAIAAAESARAERDVRIEPWIVPDGVGLLAHGPPRAGESPPTHARRLADVIGRSFAADTPVVARARTELLRRDTQGLALLASVLAPQHPSWVLAQGVGDAVARSSDGAVLARAHAIRTGPLRAAVLAAHDAEPPAAQAALDRWVSRKPGETRACRPAPAGPAPKPGTYAVETKGGAMPEAYLAFPFPANDETAKNAALAIANALDGDDGLLERALAGTMRTVSARLLGQPRAPALAIRITAAQAQLDAAVMQARALVDRIHKGGLAADEVERAFLRDDRARLAAMLDPRARLVATFRGETQAPRPTADELKAFAQSHLGEDAMLVVASRPSRRQP